MTATMTAGLANPLTSILWTQAAADNHQGSRGLGHRRPGIRRYRSEMSDLIHGGAAPIAPRDRRRYYDLVSTSLA
jgi:hypothetical protein